MSIFSITVLEILSTRQDRMHYGHIPYYFDEYNSTRCKATVTMAQILYSYVNGSISYNKALIVATKIQYMYSSALYYYTTDLTQPHITPQERNDSLDSIIATLLWHEHPELLKKGCGIHRRAFFFLRRDMYKKGYVLAFRK